MAEAAAIISGFKWLAPVAIKLLKKGYTFIAMDVDEKMRDLQNMVIPQMEMLIDAAENHPHKDQLHGWLRTLEKAVYEAEDVLDLHDYYFLKKKVKSSAGGIKVRLESLPPIKYLSKKISRKLKNSLSRKLKNSLVKLEKTVVKAREFWQSLPGGSSNVRGSETRRRVTTTSLPPHKVFGRDKQRDHIVDLLHKTAGLEPESSSVKCYSVVAIVGLGGAGKTTLAQYVCDYEKNQEPKHFDVIMWVHVSERLDVEMLIKKMVESASGEECPDLNNLDTLQKKLEGSLTSKMFLLVLDDVWSKKGAAELQWEQLLAPLKKGNRGSKILMTTREKGIADSLGARDILDLKELEKSDFLSLFRYYAFGDAKIDDNSLYKELEEIVSQNEPKLHGSPLAARMVASQLRKSTFKRTDVDVWKRTLSDDLLKDTMKSLLWSYQNLEAHLQRCFLYCSLFFKGQKISRKKLIHLWVANGIIKTVDESKSCKTIEDIGQDYFDELLSSSFFQPTEDDDLYIVHDLLHDLAEMVSKGQFLRVDGNLTEAVGPLTQEIRHLSLRIDTLHHIVEKICNFKNLRTLIIFKMTDDDYFIDDLLHNIFVKLTKLRVVDLGEFQLRKLPESIGGLKHLRHLDLHKSSFEILPESIYTLYHLEFLHISKCTFVAKGLANWINLHHLYVSAMILNVAGIGSSKQLENLRQFQGDSIHINGLENVKEKGEAPVEIKGIGQLCLEWSTTDNISRSSDMDAQVLEGLRPPPDLHFLKIKGYQSCVLPSWMVRDPHLLHNLISLKLVECRQLKQLPILSRTLKILVLSACSSLPIVSKEDLAIIRSTQDVRISQVVTFMEGLVATYGSHIVSEIRWDLRRGYDKQKLRNWLEKTMDIAHQNLREKAEAQQVLLPSLGFLDIRSCPLTNSTLREGLRGLTTLRSLKLCNIVSLTSLPSADVLGCLTVLKTLHVEQCWFLTSLGGLQALISLQILSISFCPNLSAEGGSTSILPSSLMWLVIEACHWKQYLDDSQPGPTSSINSESSDVPFAASLQLGRLKSLQSLSITNCPNIGSLLGLQELNHLQSLTLVGCPKLAHAETKLGNLFGRRFHTDAPSLLAEEALASLQHLRIAEFKEESFRSEEEQVFQHLFSLHELSFEHCSIKSLPNISFLKKLSISDCPNITSLPDLPESLRYLSITNCPNIGLLLGLQELNDLRYLTLMGCPKLAHAETKLGSPVLRSFHTDAPSLLHVLLTGEALASLPHLGIHKFKKESFSSDEEQVFRHLTSFNCLSFRSCSIKSLPNNLKSLSSLRSLSIIDCPNITSLPDLPRSLSELNLQLCNPVLKRRCHKPHGQDWCKISHIPTVFRGRGGI
ncbi:putative disease resistance protein RGA3 [Ananas comosus]|uniref:Disease resistance protein RGA3 n=1 Tax=Ananas comosus TaxID=4615 RepID=A0A6P5EAB3_ANACO|nr:putative disease resistance protein RGA3 [Ananas comosus]XP_020080126.1 putative disease resistance protein RGA3 [Ananas comosus]